MKSLKSNVVFKTVAISTLLFIESLITTSIMWNYVKNLDTPTITIGLVLKLGFMLLLLTYTYALTIGAWDKWLQYVIIPLPLSLGIFLVIATINVLYAFLIFILIYMTLSYEVYFATRMKDMLIKFDPRLVLRFSIKGMLFTYALIGAVLILMGPRIEFDLGESLSNLVHEEAEGVMENIETYKYAKDAGLIELDTKGIIKNSVNDLVSPYAQFIAPILAILTIASVSTLDWFVYVVFSATIDILFMFAKRLKFIHYEYKDVKQEILRF